MHRRFTFPLSVSIRGKVLSLANWSEGGALVPTDPNFFQEKRIEHAELLIPCSDGMYSLPLQLLPLRQTAQGWGCQFLDLPPREQAILRFFSEIVLRGDSVLMSELDSAGKLANAITPLPPPVEAPAKAKDEPGLFAKLLLIPVKHLALLLSLLVIIGLLAYFIVPYVGGNVMKKLTRGTHLETVAESRIDAAKLGVKDLENKIQSIQDMLSTGRLAATGSTLRPEQIQALEMSKSQLETEREMALVHLRVLQANLDLIRAGDFLIEEAVFAGYNTDSRISPAPYVSDVLSDLSTGGVGPPQTEEDRAKFERVARARLSQAEFSKDSVTVRRQALERIVERAEKAGIASALPQNTLDLMKRDLALLQIEENRLADTISLLKANVEAVEAGNFTYEMQLLQKFDPRPAATSGSQEAPMVQ